MQAKLISGMRSALQTRVCRSEEHTSELQSRFDLVCRLLLEKKKIMAMSAQRIANILVTSSLRLEAHSLQVRVLGPVHPVAIGTAGVAFLYTCRPRSRLCAI